MADRELRTEQATQASAPAVPRSVQVRRWARFAGLAIAPLVTLLLVFTVDRALSAGDVLRGVSVSGVPLGGLNRTEVEGALRDLGERLSAEPLRVRVREQVIDLQPEKVGFRIGTEKMADAAVAAGRSGGWLSQIGFWLARLGSRHELPAMVDLDRRALEQVLHDWDEQVLRDPPFEGAVVMREGAPAAEYPRTGHVIDPILAEQLIRESLARRPHGEMALPLTERKPRLDPAAVDVAVDRARLLLAGPAVLLLSTSPPQATAEGKKTKDKPAQEPPVDVSLRFSAEELAGALQSRVQEEQGKLALVLHFDVAKVDEKLQPLRPLLEHPPDDARFFVDDRDRVQIVPSRMGARLDVQKVAARLMEVASSDARSGLLPVEPGDPPEFSTEAATALKIEKLVSRMTTYFTCCQARVKNIQRIAAILDGRVVRPGETLSVNAAVGERTRKNGFVPAPGIEEGEMVDSVGGGVSQFATTLFNAVFYGGYEILERQAHSYYFSRYPMGHEATLSWPKPDLVFRNDTEAGMLIRTVFAKTSITVKIFGNNGGRKVTAKVSGQYDIVKPPIELLPNPKLEPDRSKVKESGSVGWSVMVARVIAFPDGTKTEEKRKVTYKPRVRRVQVHPCRIPEGQEGHTGEPCPEPPEEEKEEGEAREGEGPD
jgi:vancomycin resistance protein YoaR